MGSWLLACGCLVVSVRLSWRDAQVLPLFSAHCLGDINDLANVVTQVGERTMERFVNP